MALIIQFNSIRRTIVTLIVLPPMITGVSIGLLVTGSDFGFMALLGIISLVGIAVNNGIMLIDAIDTLLDQGMEKPQAIVNATISRFRPIVMTAITTVIGLIPLAVNGGAMWTPMAWVIIFGLMYNTVLTLILCPVLYAAFYRVDFTKIS